jgi:hypothetical protein
MGGIFPITRDAKKFNLLLYSYVQAQSLHHSSSQVIVQQDNSDGPFNFSNKTQHSKFAKVVRWYADTDSKVGFAYKVLDYALVQYPETESDCLFRPYT